jgi:hypothetical protein
MASSAPTEPAEGRYFTFMAFISQKDVVGNRRSTSFVIRTMLFEP